MKKFTVRIYSRVCILLALVAVVVIQSCGKKEKPKDIIVEKVKDKPRTEDVKMSSETLNGEFEWIGGSKYSYSIQRSASSSMAKVKNHDVRYFDNEIHLVVRRSDGTVFFDKTFTKANFSPALPKQFHDSGVLLGMNFEKANGNVLNFVVSVGSPDDSYDEFFYVLMTLDNYGNTKASVYKAHR